MSEADREPDTTRTNHEKDIQWLNLQLQGVVDLVRARGMDEYATSFTFLMFAHELNQKLAPNSLVGTAVSLKVMTQLLLEANEAIEIIKTSSTVDESNREENSSEGKTLH